MKSNTTTKTIKGFAWSFYGTGGTFIIKILVVAVLARLISVEDFGLFQAALVVVGLAQVFSDLGVGQAIIKLDKLQQSHIHTSYTLTLLLGLVFMGLFYVLAPLIALFFEMPELVSIVRAMSLLFPIKASSVISEKLLERELNFKKVAHIDIISYSVGYTLTATTLAWLDFGVWALIIAIFVQFLLRALLLFFRQPHSVHLSINRSALKDLFAFGTGITGIRIINYFALNGDNFIIGKVLSASALGIYGRAYNLMSTPINRLGAAFSRVLFPAMAQKQHEPEKLKNAFLISTAAMGFVFFPITIFCVLLAPEIIGVFLGDQWDAAILPFQILSVGMIFRVGYKIGNALGLATGQVYQVMFRHAIYAVAVVSFSLVGVYTAGVAGASAGVVAALLIQYLLSVHQSHRILNSLKWSDLLQALISPVVFSLIIGFFLSVVTLLGRRLISLDIVTLGVGVVSAVIFTYLTLLTLPAYVLGPHGYWIFNRLLSYLPDRLKLIARLKKKIQYNSYVNQN